MFWRGTFRVSRHHIIRDHKSLNSQSRRNAEAYVKSGEIFEDRQANFERQTKTQEKLVANAQILCDVLGQEMPDLSEKDSMQTLNISSCRWYDQDGRLPERPRRWRRYLGR